MMKTKDLPAVTSALIKKMKADGYISYYPLLLQLYFITTEWTGKMNNILACAREIVNKELIYT